MTSLFYLMDSELSNPRKKHFNEFYFTCYLYSDNIELQINKFLFLCRFFTQQVATIMLFYHIDCRCVLSQQEFQTDDLYLGPTIKQYRVFDSIVYKELYKYSQ